MSAEIFIARKLRLSPKGGGRKAAPSVAIAVGGVALAVVVMLLTIAVVRGFKHEITAKVTGFDAQISVFPLQQIYVPETVRVAQADSLMVAMASALPPEAVLAPTLAQPGILKTADDFLGVVFRGYDRDAGQFDQLIVEAGEIPDYSAEGSRSLIMLSSEMAAKLHLGVADRVDAYFFADGALRARKLEVAAIYRSNFGEFDALVAYASLPMLRRVGGASDGEADKVEVRGLAPDRILPAAAEVQAALNLSSYAGSDLEPMYVDNIFRADAMYFNWLDLLDMNVVVILILMGCVAGFTLVACLFIIILERVKTIGLLKAVGASNRQIRRIFLLMSGRIVAKGLAVGNAVGLALIWAESRLHLVPLDPESYYLSYVPTEIGLGQWAALNVAVVIVALLLTLIPATAISKVSPTKTMRFE